MDKYVYLKFSILWDNCYGIFLIFFNFFKLPYVLSESEHTDSIFGDDDISKIAMSIFIEILGCIAAALIIEI